MLLFPAPKFTVFPTGFSILCLGLKTLPNQIKPVNPKGNQPWIFFGRTDAEAEAPILWPPDGKSRLISKPWCWERLRAGGEGDHRGWDGWMASQIQWTWVLSKLWEIVKDREVWRATVHEVTKSQIRLSDWTTKQKMVHFCSWEKHRIGRQKADQWLHRASRGEKGWWGDG